MNKDFITYFILGLTLIALGVLTWKKRTTAFLHSYHYKNVKEEDLPLYTKRMGVAQIIFGAGFCLTAVLKLFIKGALSWLFLVLGLAAGLPFVFKAQKANNGSWF